MTLGALPTSGTFLPGALRLLMLSFAFGGSMRACSQVVLPDLLRSTPPPFKLLRFDENWSYLKNVPDRKGLDKIKYIPFGHDQAGYVSLGGEFRGAYERVLNDSWSVVPYSAYSFGLQRYQLHADVHFNSQVRTFIQLESGLEQGRAGGPRGIDEKRLDFLNAFLDLQSKASKDTTLLRIGKQELQLGSGRLVSVREGPNVRQGFFGFRVNQTLAPWTVDGFAVRPAVDRTGFFDDAPLSTTQFWGVIGTRNWRLDRSLGFNSYYYGLDRKRFTYNRGTAHEVRQTFGANYTVDPPDDPHMGKLRFHESAEAILQVGSFGDHGILAWGVATETGFSVPKFPVGTRIGARIDVSSGDRGGNTALGTFSPLFPTGNYFGVLSDTGPGPVNFRDIHPKFILPLRHGVTVSPDWQFFWRQSLRDGVYSVPGTLLVPAGSSKARFVGNRPGIEARWQIDRHMYMQTDFGVFYAGSFLRESGHSHNLNFVSYWLGYKF